MYVQIIFIGLYQFHRWWRQFIPFHKITNFTLLIFTVSLITQICFDLFWIHSKFVPFMNFVDKWLRLVSFLNKNKKLFAIENRRKKIYTNAMMMMIVCVCVSLWFSFCFHNIREWICENNVSQWIQLYYIKHVQKINTHKISIVKFGEELSMNAPGFQYHMCACVSQWIFTHCK